MEQAIQAALSATANYTVSVTNGVVCVIDQGRGKSVTNDAEAVIADLGANGVDLANQPVIYRDTEGRWDELVVRNGRFSDFRFLHTKDQAQAVDRATLRAVADRTGHPNVAGVLDSIEHHGARARFDGEKLVMDGPTGRHAIYRSVSDIERMTAHWRTFCYMTDQHREPETHRAALHLARAYLGTHQTREASYDKRIHAYQLNYSEAAEIAGVDRSLRAPVTALLTAGYSHEWAISCVRDDHLSALHRAGGDEAQFHAAFERLQADPLVDANVAGAIACWSRSDKHRDAVANAVTGTAEKWPTRNAALGAIESSFYAQPQSQQTAQQGHGRG